MPDDETGWSDSYGNSLIEKDNLEKTMLAADNYNLSLKTNEGMTAEMSFNINEGPTDILSKQAFNFLGNPKIEDRSMATLFQYINVYAKIGLITILISLFVILISPFIRKLMHGVH